MFYKIRNSIFSKVIWSVMIATLLNMSIDSQQLREAVISSTIQMNKQETLVEFFVEKIIGVENAVAEFDEQHTGDHKNKQQAKVDLLNLFSPFSPTDHFTFVLNSPLWPRYSGILVYCYFDPDAPPPKMS